MRTTLLGVFIVGVFVIRPLLFGSMMGPLIVGNHHLWMANNAPDWICAAASRGFSLAGLGAFQHPCASE